VWARRAAAARGDSADANDLLIAGGFSEWTLTNGSAAGLPDVTFAQTYLARIAYWAQAGYGWPDRYSGHAYLDVTSGGTDGDQESRNLVNMVQAIDPGGAVWITEAGDWLDHPWNPSTDENPAAQAKAARAFLTLGSIPHVEALFWYQYKSASGLWDSALVDSSGAPRESWCVLYGQTPTSCTGDPGDSGDPAD
jgi:hypothetical protein